MGKLTKYLLVGTLVVGLLTLTLSSATVTFAGHDVACGGIEDPEEYAECIFGYAEELFFATEEECFELEDPGAIEECFEELDALVGELEGAIGECFDIAETEEELIACVTDAFLDFIEAIEGVPAPVAALNRYHPQVNHSTLGHEGVDKVGVWGYFEGHWADQFEFFEVTHEGGHVAWIGMPDGDYKARYVWCEDGEAREYWDHFSFPADDGSNVVSPTINLAEVEYVVVGTCGEPDADP